MLAYLRAWLINYVVVHLCVCVFEGVIVCGPDCVHVNAYVCVCVCVHVCVCVFV